MIKRIAEANKKLKKYKITCTVTLHEYTGREFSLPYTLNIRTHKTSVGQLAEVTVASVKKIALESEDSVMGALWGIEWIIPLLETATSKEGR